MPLTPANSPFARKLSLHYQVDKPDLQALEQLTYRETVVKPGQDILARGQAMTFVILLASGWAIRSRYTPEGMRQIIHILLPGDIVTPGVFATNRTDHEITSVTECTVRFVEPAELNKVFASTKTLATAFWWATEQEYGALREQIVRLGRRSAMNRIPHLFLELHRRLHLVGLATAEQFLLPLTQTEIADTLGLSNVHVNRTLRKLVSEGYLKYDGTQIEISDYQRLANLCDFDLSHLHLDSLAEEGEDRLILPPGTKASNRRPV